VLLSSRVTDDGSPILYADDVDIASNGKIYFSDASRIAPARLASNPAQFNTMGASILEALEGRRTGRLLEFDPETGMCSDGRINSSLLHLF